MARACPRQPRVIRITVSPPFLASTRFEPKIVSTRSSITIISSKDVFSRLLSIFQHSSSEVRIGIEISPTFMRDSRIPSSTSVAAIKEVIRGGCLTDFHEIRDEKWRTENTLWRAKGGPSVVPRRRVNTALYVVMAALPHSSVAPPIRSRRVYGLRRGMRSAIFPPFVPLLAKCAKFISLNIYIYISRIFIFLNIFVWINIL